MTRIFHRFFMWKMDPISGFDIPLVFTLLPRDSTLQYKRCVHFWNNFPCLTILERPYLVCPLQADQLADPRTKKWWDLGLTFNINVQLFCSFICVRPYSTRVLIPPFGVDPFFVTILNCIWLCYKANSYTSHLLNY